METAKMRKAFVKLLSLNYLDDLSKCANVDDATRHVNEILHQKCFIAPCLCAVSKRTDSADRP